MLLNLLPSPSILVATNKYKQIWFFWGGIKFDIMQFSFCQIDKAEEEEEEGGSGRGYNHNRQAI